MTAQPPMKHTLPAQPGSRLEGSTGSLRPIVHADDGRSAEPTRHGAYVCLTVPPEARRRIADAEVPRLADRLGLRNEYAPEDGPPADSIAFLRRVRATPADIADDKLQNAGAVIHIASATARHVTQFCAEFEQLLSPQVTLQILDGVVRPPTYTGNAMHNFAYARRVVQQPGPVMPNAFLVPLRKTPGWWAKEWMERHTYFLPRYDDSGCMLSPGHVLAAAAGIPCLMRRTYWNAAEPAPAGAYDFISYIECADEAVPTFHQVCTALRDIAMNPEWAYVCEGPTWQGRRVPSWPALFE